MNNDNTNPEAIEIDTDAADTAPLPELALNEEQAEQTKGGMLLPAVQKVREAAARLQS
jgi:hypothetical protein